MLVFLEQKIDSTAWLPPQTDGSSMGRLLAFVVRRDGHRRCQSVRSSRRRVLRPTSEPHSRYESRFSTQSG